MAGAVSRASRRGCGAYPEPLEGSAARGVAAGPRRLCVAGAVSTAARRSAARGVAAGPRPACRRSYIGVCRGGVFVAAVILAFAEEVSSSPALAEEVSALRKCCADASLPCGFGRLLCVNVVRGSCANRRCENFALMSSRHAGLAPCCV